MFFLSRYRIVKYIPVWCTKPISCKTVATRSAFCLAPSYRSVFNGTFNELNDFPRMHINPRFSVWISCTIFKDVSMNSWWKNIAIINI